MIGAKQGGAMSIAAGSVVRWALVLALVQGVLGCAAPGDPVGSRVAPAVPAASATSAAGQPAPGFDVVITHLGQNMTHLLPLYVGLELALFESEASTWSCRDCPP